MARKGSKWGWLLGGVVAAVGGVALAKALGGDGVAAKRSEVAVTVKVRRGRRKVWEGTGAPPASLGAPKFKVGDILKAVEKGPDGMPSGMDATLKRKVVSLAANELVEYPNQSNLTVAIPVQGAPVTWTYQVEDPGGPVEIAEDWLIRA